MFVGAVHDRLGMTNVISQARNLRYFGGLLMTKHRRKSWMSVALGAAMGTAAFYGILALLSGRGMNEAVLPTAFETAGIYLFFFAVMWLSRRPLARTMP